MFTQSPIQHLLSSRRYHTWSPFLKYLSNIYTLMDLKYEEAAGYYGFHCAGCEDNCCFTRFYHHTLLEYLYIFEGFQALDEKKQNKVKDRALSVCRKTDQADQRGMPVRLLCPLNFDGLCLLYDFRPMICRLHGIPHELKKPGMNNTYGPGCDAFTKQCHEKDYFRFDRTPFYIEMAALEKDLKQSVGMTQKVKYTVAQMIQSFGLSPNIS